MRGGNLSDVPNGPLTGVSGEGLSPYEEEFGAIGRILQRDADQIMKRWFKRALQEQPREDVTRHKEVMDHLLQMLRSLGRRLQEQTNEALEQASDIAEQHGRQRSDIGWDIGDAVRDYEILHGVTLEHLGEVLSQRLTYRQAKVIATVIDRAIGASVESFSQLIEQERDLTHQEALEEQVRQQQSELRQLTLDLTNAEHRQRQQMANILHEDFQQILVSAQMKLNAWRTSPPSPAKVEEVREMLAQLLRISRDMTGDMHPIMLELRNLPGAIEWLAGSFQDRYGLKVTVNLHVAPDSDPGRMPLRLLMYDAVRELLFNVVKHAETDEAWVNVCCEGESPWVIEVEDRGVGSDGIEEADAPPGQVLFGLANIRHRLQQIGGSLEFHSRQGEGTRVVLTVPQDAEREEE